MAPLLLIAQMISLTLSPKVCVEPCNVVAVIKVEPSKNNKKIVLEQEASDMLYYRLSKIEYNDDYAPNIFQVTYPGVLSGKYQIRAILHKYDGSSWIAVKSINVKRAGGK